MRTPRYTEELLQIGFFWLGITFVFTGALGYVGILKPKASSMVQDPHMMGIVFASVGIAFIVVHVIFRIIAINKKKLHDKLLSHGTLVNGKVDKVSIQKYIRYGKVSPYRIYYSYAYQGKTHQDKSCLLWDKPDCSEGDSIMVYGDDSGKTTIIL